MKHTSRRTAIAAAAAAAMIMLVGPALAQDSYPSKPVSIIVPQAAGGANDAIARASV